MLLRWLLAGALASLCAACETGVAFERNVLSVPRSLMANADVALLKNFTTDSLKQCMEQCCTGRFGACSVASFKQNATAGNCLHFYCRPLSKCKFQPSALIDSFSFSSNPTPAPSKAPSVDDFKNDNTTVKPRKGVDDDFAKSGIKPRKGVSEDSGPLSDIFPSGKSNVKPRKGVEPPPPSSTSSSGGVIVSSPLTTTTANSDDFIDLANILADDSTTTTTTEVTQSTSSVTPTPSSSTSVVVPTSSPTTTTIRLSSSTDSYVSTSTRNTMQPSSSSTTTTRTPPLRTTSVFETSTASVESSSNRLVASTISKEKEEEEEENDRRYKSSIHLVLSLVFGLLVLVTVLGVVAKRIYDGWLRRDYYRMNYLIDGIYNGVE